MNAVPPAAGAGAGAVVPQGAWNGPFDPLQFAIIKLLKQISITHHGRAEQVMVIGYARIIANLPQATIDAIIAQRNVVEHNTRTRFLGIGQDVGDNANTPSDTQAQRTTACEMNVANTILAISQERAALVWHPVSDHNDTKYVPLYGLTGNQQIDDAMAKVSRYVVLCCAKL